MKEFKVDCEILLLSTRKSQTVVLFFSYCFESLSKISNNKNNNNNNYNEDKG